MKQSKNNTNRNALFFQESWRQLNNSVDILILRNYEELPESLGNDIDFLVMSESIEKVCEICALVSRSMDFKIVRLPIRNNLISFRFEDNADSSNSIKMDFFTGLSKGWIVYANPRYVLDNRVKFKNYYVPSLTHEAYLLLMKELFMYKRLRTRYVMRFLSKYRDIDFEEVYKLSKGWIARSSIKKIESEYNDIANLILTPRPTIRNAFQPLMALSWAYRRIRYNLTNSILK